MIYSSQHGEIQLTYLFPNHFTNISKSFGKVCYLKEICSFCSHLFCSTVKGISNDNSQSFQLSFELLFKLEIDLEENLLDQKLNKLENELSRIEMKQVNMQFFMV